MVEYCQMPVPVAAVTEIPLSALVSTSVTEVPNRLLTVVAAEFSLAMMVPSVGDTAVNTGASFTPVIVTVTRAVSEFPLPSNTV